MNNNSDNFEYCLQEEIRNKIISSFKQIGMYYEIYTIDDSKLKFTKLTNIMPHLNYNTKKYLMSLDRIGKCHTDSLTIAKKLNTPCKLVSGFCTMLSKKMPFLHSWVEVELEDGKYVLDSTMNLAMNKKGYYKLFNPKNTIKIDNFKLKEDCKLIEKTSFINKDLRMYLFFPEEVRNLMKNELRNNKENIHTLPLKTNDI
jgi:hypothetical protein